MRLAYYAGASTAAAAACLLKAFHERPNFYSATVYLSQSNACLLILTNLLLVMACSFMFALQRLLYGPLRPIEIEQLSEKAWYAVLDTLLAMPSFREDVGGWLLTMFVLLLAGKVWGWIGEGRVDVLEQQPPANPRLFHARLATSLVLSVVFDVFMLHYCVETVVADPRPGMMVIFTFEFAILCIFSSFTLLRYGLTVWEMAIVKNQTRQAIETRKSEIRAERRAARQSADVENDSASTATFTDDEPIEVDENEVDVPGWEEKRRYLFALEVFTDFLKLMIYIVFFTVSITFNGLPMHIMRDVYMTFASFSKRVTDYVAYRKATSDMNSRYPDATTEEIRGDACIVCRESMVAWEQPDAGADAQPAAEPPAAPRRRDEGLRAKKLPCGHILHLRCLKAWLERQQVCPTCRRPVITATAPPSATGGGNGNPPAQGHGQNGQRQAPRPRARMFNIGPLRVGLLNAPNNQMQNILNQLQNPDAQNQNAANQQGPNHLGLQAPYATQPANGQSGNVAAQPGRASVPVQMQLMQLQQRIMQEAHNLGIEQQQLHYLRLMEAELARLRALHVPSHPPSSTNGAQPQATQTASQNAEYQPFMPLQPTLPFQHALLNGNRVEALHGQHTQRIASGSTDLPSGLVLPEGWTLLPLRRADGSPSSHVPQVSSQQQAQDATTATSSISGADQGAANPTATALADSISTATDANARQNIGPTDDRGSPMFVPSESSSITVGPSANSAPVQPGDEQHTTLDGSAAPGTEAPSTQPQSKTPWSGDSWSFSDTSNSTTTDPAPSQSAQSSTTTNGHPPEHQEAKIDKGKGRAVKIEDAPDPDAGT